MPSNGRITGRLAEQRFLEKPEGSKHSTAAQLARLAVRQDPTSVSAVATLAFQAQLRGDQREARRLFAFSQRLTRRHLQTQIWAVEDAVAREDIPAALRHYDTALRTSLVAPDLMFPVLASALSDQVIRENLVVTLAKQPPWSPRFLAYALANGGDPRAIMSLLIGLRRGGVPVAPEVSASVINRLILTNAPEDAWRYYASVRPNVDRSRSRDPNFSNNPTPPSPFDWNVASEPGIAASIQPGVNGGLFDFSAPASASGILLKQVQMLPPGSYRLEGHSTAIEQPETSGPYWVLMCRENGELGRVEISNSAQANGVFTGLFNVPAGCPVQTLALVARASDAIGGTSGQIDRVQLAPAR
jgi:hypothetical protein